MKKKQLSLWVCCLLLPILGCDKANNGALDMEPKVPTNVFNSERKGATQIEGIGYYASPSQCDFPSMGAVFAIHLTGDLEGCLYVFMDSHECSPSGTYRQTGTEHFVGTYKGEAGSFWTTYRFEGKFEGCSEEGFFLGAEIFGRCQHPIQEGSGDGVFEGVRGRLDLKDIVETGEFLYRGHLKY